MGDRRDTVIRLAAALLATTLPAAAIAAGPLALDLPAGPLGASVAQLGRAGGVSIAVEGGALWSRPVPAMRGRYSMRAALDRLAAAAGAEVQALGPGLWKLAPRRVAAATLRPRPAVPRRAPVLVASVEPVAVDVVVTASKRDVRLRDVAGMAAVIAGREFETNGPTGTDGVLARVASLSSTHLGAGRNKLFIRGIADSSFTGPTQSTVGQYLGDVRLTYNAPDPDLRLVDMRDVEVLEGPQGSLYGAGSLGGIIRLTPNEPGPAFAGAAAVGATVTQHGDPGVDASGMLNLPLADGLGVRLVGYGSSEGGYIDNPVRGVRDINRTRIAGGRATVRIEPAAGWTVDVGGVAQRTRGEDSQYADRDAPRLIRRSAVAEGFAADYVLGQIVVSGELGSVRLRSSTAVIEQQLRERYDATTAVGQPVAGVELAGAPLSRGEARLFAQVNQTSLFAHETRLWRPMAAGWSWLLGGSYTDNGTRLGRALGPPGTLVSVTGVKNRVREQTLYGELSAEPLSGLIVTGGARLSHARVSGAVRDVVPQVAVARAAVTARRGATSFLPSGSVLAHVRPGVTLFARYQQGFRPGGLAIEGLFVRRFEGDRLSTLEGGLRLGRAGAPAELSLGVSHTRWHDIQADFIDGFGLPSTANIGDGRIWTVSAAGNWRPLTGFRLDAGLAFNDSAVTAPAAALFVALARGSRVPNVARYAARAGFEWTHELGDGLDLRATGWVRYVGRSRLGIGPLLGDLQGDYLDNALTLRIGRPRLGVTLGLTNIGDAAGNRFALGTPFTTGREQVTPLRPRTLRIGLDAGF
ncbi:TonB-dependent receptor [Sphingomonas jatrophae]|uniref:Outer membrane receptor proteins, mostly Fe transport n=1 Tax=Sphingomonas jatrophae TaxID=1166337 RepID=A0A1I6JXP5_9SPHN|nr:TonB-dependent receptor [Sphingomonas jatrophae]SFR83765.1 Outer membrane receptor proteins, mostly Fe transport [Sphingomonas jatrophae]